MQFILKTTLSLIALASLGSPLAAQNPASAGQTASEKTVRILIYFPAPDAKKSARELDPNAAVKILLKQRLRESGRFEPLSYSISEAPIQKSLSEHTLSSGDLIEPISPDALKRIAEVLGASRLMIASAHREAEAFVTDVQLLERYGSGDWQVRSLEQIKTPLVLEQEGENGKIVRRRLRTAEAATVTADSLAVGLGLSSQLSPDLISKAPVSPAAPSLPKSKPPKETKTSVSPNRSPVEKSAEAVRPPRKQNPDAGIVSKPPKTSPPEKALPDTPRSPNANPAAQGVSPLPGRVNGGFSEFSTDGAGGRVDEPKIPEVGSGGGPAAAAKFDTETTIARYRQSGDLANVIQALRRAINDKPKEAGLRRQLILAYKERQMLDAALAEANRSLQIMPEESGLYRAKGDILAARGDTNGAAQAYNEAIQRGGGTNLGAQIALADALLADGRFDEAAKGYETALKTDSKSPLPLRRLARAAAGRAAADPAQYAVSLNYLKEAKALTPASETDGYLDDYAALLRLLETRLKEALGEAQGDLQAQRTGKLTTNDLKRSLADLKDRAAAISDYLEALPPAAGQDITHAHYQMSASLLLQGVSLYRGFLNTADPAAESAVRGAIVDGLRELNDAAKRLSTTKPQ